MPIRTHVLLYHFLKRTIGRSAPLHRHGGKTYAANRAFHRSFVGIFRKIEMHIGVHRKGEELVLQPYLRLDHEVLIGGLNQSRAQKLHPGLPSISAHVELGQA